MTIAVNSFRIRHSSAALGLYSKLFWVPPTLGDEILNSQILDECSARVRAFSAGLDCTPE